MILYEYRRGSSTKYYRPSFRVRVHTNPILRAAKAVRIIKRRLVTQRKGSLSLIPKKSKIVKKTY